ncbi:hypothetical protein [Streptomyces sp. 1331.2]|uniref:hypothetical protein n=1 Tax=Streptomyces sp. 1331.2 TaxID=1938835 RepID=UPI000BCBBFD0|nr:hypothetical protein [Streptomyces sp. 1331.2]SOB85862.1 hypothetical protein SAMN06272789_6163 [Streptomyces sp. 1331.2]
MQGSGGGVHNEMSDVTARVAVQAQVANFITVAPGAAAPEQVERSEETQQLVLPDLRRCAAALGVPPGEVEAVADWLGRIAAGDAPRQPCPVALPPDTARELEAFATHLVRFVRPELMFTGRKVYLSRGKLDDMYGLLAHRLGDTDDIRPIVLEAYDPRTG